MRRRPYSELLATAQSGPPPSPANRAQTRPALARPGFQAPAPVDSPPAKNPGASTLSAEAALKCRAEIRLLSAMIDKYRSSTDKEGRKMCLFADEKVARATMALDGGDGDDAWVQLFGAAMLCRTFQILPEEADRAIGRLNSMLG